MEREAVKPLSYLTLGRCGIVSAIIAEGIIKKKLLNLGLTPGAAVKAVIKSPSGDPIAYEIRGALVALRLEEGEKVFVQELYL